MFIDIHAHAYRKCPPFLVPFATAEQVIERYDREGIEKGVLLPIVNPEVYFPQANEDILEMCDRYPDRLIPFCNIDPRVLTNSADAPLDKVLGYYRDLGCKGVGEIMLNVPTLDPLVQNLFKHAASVGLPVTWDGSDVVGGDFGLYDDPGLPQMEHTLQRHPDLVVIAHGPVFWHEISRVDRPATRKPVFHPAGGQTVYHPPRTAITEEGVIQGLFRDFPNLYGELSDAFRALGRDEDYGPKFLAEFQDRLMFGTDMCGTHHEFRTLNLLRKWHDAGKIEDVEFNKIMRENAIRVLQLT